MENCTVLDLVFKVHQDGILDKLGLQEALFINWTVKEALVAEIPEKVHGIVFGEEVLRKVSSEISNLVPEEVHGLIVCVVVHSCP